MDIKVQLNTLRPRQNGRHFADIFKCIFLNENVWIPLKISLTFVPKGPINNIPTLVQIMAWRRSGDKPLSEPMMFSLSTHICVTQLQWVNRLGLIISAENLNKEDTCLDTFEDNCIFIKNMRKGRLVWYCVYTRGPGVGVTKPISSVPLFSEFFSIVKTYVRYWISRLYLAGIAAAQLRWYLSNMKVIQRMQQVLLKDRKFC